MLPPCAQPSSPACPHVVTQHGRELRPALAPRLEVGPRDATVAGMVVAAEKRRRLLLQHSSHSTRVAATSMVPAPTRRRAPRAASQVAVVVVLVVLVLVVPRMALAVQLAPACAHRFHPLRRRRRVCSVRLRHAPRTWTWMSRRTWRQR